MDDQLLPWLRTQIAETARIAQAAKASLDSWAPGLPPWESARYLGKFASYFDTFVARLDPDAALAQCEAHTLLLDEASTWKHVVEADGWYSCSQAVADWGDNQPPGSGCVDQERAGKPCDCGRDDRVERIHRLVAMAYRHCPGYRPEWQPRK